MSVCLGQLKRANAPDVEVWAGNYDDDELWLCCGDQHCQVEVFLDRRQLQELSKIIDRFLQ